MNLSCYFRISTWLIVLTMSQSVFAQLPGYQLNRIHEEGGLKTSDVLNIVRDKKGFIWIASQGSVQRFDGKHTEIFLFNETIVSILIDADDRKWVRTRTGIYRYTEGVQGFSQTHFNGDSLSATTIYNSSDNHLMVLAEGNYYRYHDQQEQFLPDKQHQKSRTGYARYFGSAGEEDFFGTRDSIFRFNRRKGETGAAFINNISTAIILSATWQIVSTMGFKTYYVNIESGEKKILGSKIDGESFGDNLVVFSGVHLSGQTFLLCSNKGLFQYDISTDRISHAAFYYDGRPLQNQQSIKSVYKDHLGNIYMNHADGIYFFNSRGSFIQYFRNNNVGAENLSSNDVRNFAEDKDGNIWMATINGITKLEVKTGLLEHFGPLNGESIIDFPSYRQLLSDGANLWIGTSGIGVWLFNTKQGITRRPEFAAGEQGRKDADRFSKSYVWEIIRLKNKKLLVISGLSFFLIEPDKLNASRIPLEDFKGISRAGIQDSTGRIWHGTTAGLAVYDSLFKTIFTIRDSFPDKRIATFCEWKKNRVLVGTKGLFEVELKGNRIVSFKRKNGIPHNQFIYCMKQDQLGYVWAGTDEGIFRYDPVKDEAIRFDRSDHVQSHAFNSDGAFLSSSGLMYMGGKNGVNYFDPRNYTSSSDSLHPLVLSVSTNPGDTTYFGSGHTIPYSNRNLNFIINAPDFKKPFRIQYRYKLKTENEWNYTGYNNHVHIGKIQPGNYLLQVAASYNGQTWFNNEDPVSFKVMAPWWQTWWFMIICAGAFAGALTGVAHFRRRRREAREMKRMINYFSNSPSTGSSVDLILWDVTTNCISLLGFDDCVIYLYDEERKMLVQKAAYGAKSTNAFEIKNPIEISLGQGITGHAAQIMSSIIVNDTSRDSRYIIDDEKRYSELAVPIIHDGRLIGVIDSENRKKKFFTEHHLRTLESISALCADKIAVAIALEETRKAESEVAVLNAKMMESKFANLRLQMNPHFLFNILTTIQYLIVSKQVTKATEYLNLFSSFLRSLLNFAEDTVVTLEDELKVLTMYVELESFCLDETFEWNIHVDEEIDQEEVKVPFMLLQPFVENAINHGLVHKTGKKSFSISIREHDGDSLVCTIEDSGIGRAASLAINQKNLSRVVHPSKGLGIVKKRLDLLQEKTGQKASLHIEDLYKNDVAAGTLVKIIIPYYSYEEI